MSESSGKRIVVDPYNNATRPWVGKAFLALAAVWFAAMFLIMRPDKLRVMPFPAPTITLPDGTRHKIYQPSEILGAESGWFKPVDYRQQFAYAMFTRGRVIRFIVLAAGLPIGVLVLGLFGLAAVEMTRRVSPVRIFGEGEQDEKIPKRGVRASGSKL
jgi:hypothetical protein